MAKKSPAASATQNPAAVAPLPCHQEALQGLSEMSF